MKIKAIHSRVLSTAASPDQATYEEDAGLVLPERFAQQQPGFHGRIDDRHRCVYPSDRSTVLVAIETENGLVGYGEAHAPVAPRVAHAIVIDLLAPVLLGQDARQIQILWEQMFAAMRLRSHTMGFTAEAIAGLDIALWDLLGKYRQEPVWMLLGGAHRRQLPVYSSGVPGSDTQAQIENIERILARGFTAIKCSCGRGSLQTQMDLVRPLSAALGTRGKLMVDAHGGFDLNDALRFAHFLQDLGNVEWFEDALVPEDADGYARLTQATPGLRIAMGETECNRYGVRDRLRNRQCDVLLPDVCRAGGISETWRIAQLADTFSVLWASHVSISTPLHLTAGLHIGAATPNFLVSEYPTSFDESPLGKALCTDSPTPENGSITVSDAPGLGVTLDEAQVERLTALYETRSI
ncbi:MAG: mandelate racemase/muconate lactonizing enzyme family protein [Candidatus Latescibacterota bacterium]